jgi:hypothetical protein
MPDHTSHKAADDENVGGGGVRCKFNMPIYAPHPLNGSKAPRREKESSATTILFSPEQFHIVLI